MELNKIHVGDTLEIMRTWPAGFVHTCVTSPPYWGLRDYGVAGQLGLEPTPEAYVEAMVAVFREVRRVLRDDGTLWLNIGDCYSNAGTRQGDRDGDVGENGHRKVGNGYKPRVQGIKNKDLVGIPWLLAFALRADGWYLRSDIIWSKPNPMPESVQDRPTRAHEYIFLLSKGPRYYYDAAAIRLPATEAMIRQVMDGYNGEATKDFLGNGVQDASGTKKRIIEGARKRLDKQRGHSRRHDGFNDRWDHLERAEQLALGSNRRTVWTVAPANFDESHFATFPEALISPCIMAGAPSGGVVLDPFMGAGTTALVAAKNNRSFIGTELNPEYAAMAEKRIAHEMAQGKLL